jgi:hypothetical protein
MDVTWLVERRFAVKASEPFSAPGKSRRTSMGVGRPSAIWLAEFAFRVRRTL